MKELDLITLLKNAEQHTHCVIILLKIEAIINFDLFNKDLL